MSESICGIARIGPGPAEPIMDEVWVVRILGEETQMLDRLLRLFPFQIERCKVESRFKMFRLFGQDADEFFCRSAVIAAARQSGSQIAAKGGIRRRNGQSLPIVHDR
jgi:hypothetical protein